MTAGSDTLPARNRRRLVLASGRWASGAARSEFQPADYPTGAFTSFGEDSSLAEPRPNDADRTS